MARHKLIQSFALSLKVNPENPVQEPAIFVIVDSEDSEPVNFWINKGRVDNLCLIMPESWDLMIRADIVYSRQYSLLGSMDPENIIKQNNNIPLFFFWFD